MADIGTAYVRVAPNMTGIQGKIAAGFKGSAGPATAALGDEVNRNSGPFQTALGKLGGFAKGAGIAIGAGLAAGAAGLAALTSKAVMAQAELEQQLGGSEAVFGDLATSIGGVQAIAEEAYFKAGLSQQEFLQGANKMGSLFQGAGFSVRDSMTMSTESMQRASDIASIMGISTAEALEAVTGMAKGNFTMMDNLGVAMNDTSLNAYALEKGLGKTTAQMSIQEKVGLAQQLFMEKTAKYAGNYAKENETLSGSLNTTKKAFDNLLAGQGDIDGFIDSLVGTIKIAVPQIVKLLPQIVKSISAVFGALVPALSAAMPALVPALINAVQGLLNALIKALPSVVNTLVQALPMFINAFIQIFLALVNALPQIIQILAAATPQIINALVNGLTSPAALQAMIMAAIQIFLAILQAIPIIIPALVGAIPVIVKNIVQTLTSSQFIAAMMNAGIQLLKATVRGLLSVTGSVISASWEIMRTIANVLSPSNMSRIGGDMVRGLWDGIQGLGGWLQNKIVAFVKDKIPGPVKKALGINSPSKVFAEFGRNIDQGMALGVDKHAGMVEKSVTNMANSAMVGFTSSAIDPSMAFSPSSAAMGGIGSTNNSSSQTTNIEKVVLSSEGAVKAFFNELNQDTIRLGMGITPTQGATP